MKRQLVASLLGIAASSLVVASSYGQGQILFQNYTILPGGGIAFAYVTDFTTGANVSGYTADLLFSLDGTSWNQVSGSAAPITGGIFANPDTLIVPGYVTGPVMFQVEAFDGADFGSSLNKGMSTVFTIPSLAVTGTTTPVGDVMNSAAAGYLEGFTVGVPEPSTFALAGLGLASLYFVRRRK